MRVYHNLQQFNIKVNCMRSLQFDHEESENRGHKIPWFILKAPGPKNPK